MNEPTSGKVLTDMRTEPLGDMKTARKSGLQGATLLTDNAATPRKRGMCNASLNEKDSWNSGSSVTQKPNTHKLLFTILSRTCLEFRPQNSFSNTLAHGTHTRTHRPQWPHSSQ